MVHSKRNICRACGGSDLRLFLSLGPTPLANSFLRSPDEFLTEPSYPLDVYFCGTCSLVQLLDVIDPEILFKDYIYVTGTSDTIASHNFHYAQDVTQSLQLERKDLVVEIASNDGSLLKCFQKNGLKTLGVEPATNIAELATAAGVETINQFFNASTAEGLRESYGPAKVIIGNNVLAHVDQIQDFLYGCRYLLREDGFLIIEVPYLRELIDRLEYDTIYHEHLSYFSVGALINLYNKVGLSIQRIDEVPVHGGSLRIYAQRSKGPVQHSAEVLTRVDGENKAGLHDFSRYEIFTQDVQKSRSDLCDLLEALKSQGKTIAGYGAPAKGNTLLNYCGIGPQLLHYTVDKNQMKVGLFTPGMHIPVLPVNTLLVQRPDFVLILAWNFAQEIMNQQHQYRELGGKFIIPIPSPYIV